MVALIVPVADVDGKGDWATHSRAADNSRDTIRPEATALRTIGYAKDYTVSLPEARAARLYL
jgi:hypothetical protein